ncbi:hypothetical protein BDP27DRAFT_1373753 [Rhodocollybia butyracea]|uniref:Uncharacterized protein n=1 Tax=Rhodocollybia butyracea TaxID=206335 RepID=A0A9P5P666_9AGAR|nr:hypothetical protein BDP27DRAFT_1373753 [Rhodocollybia butyracea]
MAKNLFDSSPANLDTQREYGWSHWTEVVSITTQNIQSRKPHLMQGRLGKLLKYRGSLLDTKQSRKRKASPSPATRMAKKPRLEVVAAKPTQNEQQHLVPKAGRVVLADHKLDLGKHGVEQGQSLEMVSKDRKHWRKINWSTDIRVGAGDLILLRPEGVTNTAGWEVDYDNM